MRMNRRSGGHSPPITASVPCNGAQPAVSSMLKLRLQALRALYEPKLVTVLRHGYGASELRRDLMAGLTVAIVALPLAMALAIASGTSPEKGLHTAIVAGFLISVF